MLISFSKYYYQVILDYSEESLTMTGTFLKYYDKNVNGVYYPSILSENNPFPISRNVYVLKDRVYSDKLTDTSEKLTSTGTYEGDNIYLLNNWVIDCRGLLLEKPAVNNTFLVINYDNNYASLFDGDIPKENDIVRFQDNNIVLGDEFTIRIDIKSSMVIWENNLIVNNLKNP